MEKESKIDADKIIQNYKITNVEAFKSYLREVFMDLVKRSTQPSKGIDRTTFFSYYKLPGIIGERMFEVFDKSNIGFIDLEEFTNNMETLFCSNFDEISKIIFKLYDFTNNGEISKEDIRTLLSYVTLEAEENNKIIEEINYNHRVNSQQELEEMLDICFNNPECNKKSMSYFNFIKVIENVNSDIYFLILLFLYDKKPFSKIGVNEYEKHKNISKSNIIKSPERYIIRPSKKSIFSSCLDNLKSPNRRRFFLDQIDQNLLYREKKKNRTVKEKNKILNDIVLTELNNNDEDISPKIAVSRRKKNQNLNKIEVNDSNKKKKINKDDNNNNISFTSMMNKNIYEPIGNSTTNYNKKSKFKTSKNSSPINKKKRNEKNDNLINLNSMDKEDEIFNFEKEESSIRKRENIKLIDFQESDSLEFEEEVIKYEGYLYKIINNQINKLWFKLVHNDLYFFKNQKDTQHKGLHNLNGIFLEEIPSINKNNKIYYGFSLSFPKIKREYYTDDLNSYKLWMDSLKLATNSTNITKDYIIEDEIGSGKFGVIRLSKNKHTGKKYAIKLLSKKNMNSSDLELVRTEIEILKICQHPNIIKLYNIFENSDYFYIIMEYCSGGDLFSYLEKKEFKLSEKKACEIISKICRALYYIHSYGIVHRDLKPENILMTDESENADIRLLDFGLSKILGPDETCNEPYGTLSYCAPEVIKGENYNKNVDLFSIGVITYLILSGQLPFNHKNSESEIARLTIFEEPSFKSRIWNNISSEAIHFIKGMLKKNPNERFSIKDAIEHKWFKKFDIYINGNKESEFEKYSSPIRKCESGKF